MKIPAQCLIEKACSTDLERPVLLHPYLDTTHSQGPVMVACNGAILAVVPVTEAEIEESGPVPAEALKVARRAKGAKQSGAYMSTNEGTVYTKTTVHGKEDGDTSGVQRFDRPTYPAGAKFPNWEAVVPPKDRHVTVKVGLNIEQLWKLCQALGCEAATLEISGSLDPVVVRPLKMDNCVTESLKAAPPACPEAYGVISTIRP